VGGGIVGLTLACAFKDSGLSVALIEAKLIPSPQQRGNLRISPVIEAHFEGNGVWDKILNRYFSDKFASQMPIIPVWWNSNQQI